jgi:hypothetical protein
MKISNDAQKYSEYAARLNRAVMAASRPELVRQVFLSCFSKLFEQW